MQYGKASETVRTPEAAQKKALSLSLFYCKVDTEQWSRLLVLAIIYVIGLFLLGLRSSARAKILWGAPRDRETLDGSFCVTSNDLRHYFRIQRYTINENTTDSWWFVQGKVSSDGL